MFFCLPDHELISLEDIMGFSY